jgi:hypothetical protein
VNPTSAKGWQIWGTGHRFFEFRSLLLNGLGRVAADSEGQGRAIGIHIDYDVISV